jgi:IS1 family transposase
MGVLLVYDRVKVPDRPEWNWNCYQQFGKATVNCIFVKRQRAGRLLVFFGGLQYQNTNRTFPDFFVLPNNML